MNKIHSLKNMLNYFNKWIFLFKNQFCFFNKQVFFAKNRFCFSINCSYFFTEMVL